MLEACETLSMITSKIRRAIKGLNVYGVIIVFSREFGDIHDVNRRLRIVKTIFEVAEVIIAIVI